MKLYIYWMDNNFGKHFETKMEGAPVPELEKRLDSISRMLDRKVNNGEIRDFQVELRY